MSVDARLPQFKDFTATNFITEAILVGCAPNLGLFIEFAKEPAGKLALLFFLPDAFDIGQAIFEPRRGRRTKPNRHGRKRPRRFGIPDVNDLIGGKARSVLNPYDALKVGPFRYLFPILNVVEGVTFAAAVVEGLVETTYSGMLGAFLFDGNNCREFARYCAMNPNNAAEGTNTTIAISPTIANVGFDSSLWTCKYEHANFLVAFQCEVKLALAGGPITATPVLRKLNGTVMHEGGAVEISYDNWVTAGVGGEIPAGEWCEWAIEGEGRFLTMRQKQVLAFSVSWLLGA